VCRIWGFPHRFLHVFRDTAFPEAHTQHPAMVRVSPRSGAVGRGEGRVVGSSCRLQQCWVPQFARMRNIHASRDDHNGEQVLLTS